MRCTGAHGKGSVASEWASQVAGGVGGGVSEKGGATSTGNRTDVTDVDGGLEIAVKYLEKLHI